MTLVLNGFLFNDKYGNLLYIADQPIEIFVEIPGDKDFEDLNKWLPITLACQDTRTNLQEQPFAFKAEDRDDLFACWVLNQNLQEDSNGDLSNQMNVGSLFDALRNWEQLQNSLSVKFESLKPPYQSIMNKCHETFEKFMPSKDGWTRRLQKFVIRSIADRFRRLAHFGCFNTLSQFSQSSDNQALLAIDLKSVNLSSVQVAFMIDATGSMGPYIDQAKATVQTVMVEIRKKFNHSKVTFACVLYRDHDCQQNGNQIEVFTFGTDKDLAEWLATKTEEGGMDLCEDVAGGLKAVDSLNWEAATRLLIWIADAPAHTSKYHDFKENSGLDDYPLGYPTGQVNNYVEPSVTIRNLRQKAIRVFFFKIPNKGYTDKMIRVLSMDYESVGQGLQINISELQSDTQIYVQTINSISESEIHKYETDRRIRKLGRISLESIKSMFSPNKELSNQKHPIVIVGGDKILGASAQVIAPVGYSKIE